MAYQTRRVRETMTEIKTLHVRDIATQSNTTTTATRRKHGNVHFPKTRVLKPEPHGTDTDTDTDIRDAPIVQFCKRVHNSLSSCIVHVHVYTRASPTDILARKSARVEQKSADKSARIVVHACPARGELNGPRAPRQADFRARILARKWGSPCRCRCRSRGI